MTTHSIVTGSLGFPRIGSHRELKFALERFWSGEWTSQQLETAARDVRHAPARVP
jgi:5-methyltetrahydropteroyltriglutamate--homocysteine methyltransferase